MKKFICITLIFLLSFDLFAAKKSKKSAPTEEKLYELELSQDDIVVLPEDETHFVRDGNGIHLFVKKSGDIKSISLLIDSDNYNDPDLSLIRDKKFNSVNGNEVRYSYGSKSEFRMTRLPNALIATATDHIFFGDCFHIYIPQEMYYGYVIQTQNECRFEDGMNINIRTYAQEHSDNGAQFFDNKLFLNVSDWQTEEAFAKIASETDGKVMHVISASELTKKLTSEIDSLETTEKIDIVFAIDATDSMKDDFVELRKNWLPQFENQMKGFADAKIGLLFYKDYGDEFKTKGLPVKIMGFYKKASGFSKAVKTVSVKGGGDKEEAVLEALFCCVNNFKWREEASKKVILIGDAPPHVESQNGFDYTFSEIVAILNDKNICVDCFLISDSKQKTDDMKTLKKSEAATELIKSVEMINAK